MPMSRASCRWVREWAMTFAPKARNSRAVRRPMAPVPTMPTVLPQISVPRRAAPVPPCRTAASQAGTNRRQATASPRASSATHWVE